MITHSDFEGNLNNYVLVEYWSRNKTIRNEVKGRLVFVDTFDIIININDELPYKISRSKITDIKLRQ